MLSLHVWGSAFSLPSIDPNCLAAIAYLSQTVPQTEWELIASSDPTLSPTRELPALRDGSIWIGGFQNIAEHLREKSGGQWDLDRDCSSQDRADITAFTSFLGVHGQPLVDLSLYVSSENYHSATRPAYSRILRWPSAWILPPQRRAAAKARTDHLGLSALNLDSLSDDENKSNQFGPSGAEVSQLLRSTQQTVSSLVRQPQHASRFRLDALAEDFFDPLVELLQGKYYLISSEKMTSLDCIALGYLSLALVPEVPHSWLAETMKKRYPALCHYVEDMVRDCFGVHHYTRGPMAVDEDDTINLPWIRYEPESIIQAAPAVLRGSLESIPFVGGLYRPETLQNSTTKPHHELSKFPILPSIFVGLITSITALGGYVIFTGSLPILEGTDRRRNLADMGEAGAMLGAFDISQSL